jgi:hypothetical protein
VTAQSGGPEILKRARRRLSLLLKVLDRLIELLDDGCVLENNRRIAARYPAWRQQLVSLLSSLYGPRAQRMLAFVGDVPDLSALLTRSARHVVSMLSGDGTSLTALSACLRVLDILP